VQDHEDWGHKTRNWFLVVGALELLALGLGQKPARRWVYVGSALVGLAGGYCLFEAGEHGGDLVYNYAGGVGIRSGQPADVDRLLLAGLYQKAMADRKAGDSAGAAVLIAELVARFPADTDIQLLGIESLLTDKKDPKAALAALQKLPPLPDSSRARTRRDMLATDVYAGAGRLDSARAILTRLAAQFPQSQRIKDKLAQLPAH
jgi:TolA-binding protein